MERKKMVIIVLITLVLTVSGCDLLMNIFSPSVGVFNAANEIVPTFESTSSRSISTEWPYSPTYELFYALQPYNNETDEGKIDASNFFKLMYDADQNISSALRVGAAIDEKVIQEPFEFGNDITYDYAANETITGSKGPQTRGFAYKERGDDIHFLSTWKYEEEETKVTLGQIQGSYNSVTGELDFKQAYVVNYGGEEYYSVRSEVTGNQLTHTFDLKIATASNDSMGFHGMSIAGSGISQGSGSYFLIKMNDGTDLIQNGERFYVFEGTASETELQAMDALGLTYSALPETVTDYSVKVNDIVLFVGTDMPTSLEDFNNGNISLTF